MRIKFHKEYLKYYTYAILGIITIILFYHISDNLGFIPSGIKRLKGTDFKFSPSLLYIVPLIGLIFRLLHRIKQKSVRDIEKVWPMENTIL